MTTLEALNGMAALVAQVFPGEGVYTNRVREDFERPATLVQCGKLTVTPLTGGISEYRLAFILTSFVEVDAYHDSHYEDLVSRQEKLLGLFAENCVCIGGRYPHVEALEAGYGLDYSEVKATLSWEEIRAERPGRTAEHYKISI